MVWAPYRKVDIERIESVQKQFLLFALKSLGFEGFRLPPYRSRLLLLNMTTLELRREMFSATFAYDLIKNGVRSESLAARIIFDRNLRNLRNVRLLVEEMHRTDYTYNDSVARAIRNFNKYGDCFDEAVSRDVYKSRIDRKFKRIY